MPFRFVDRWQTSLRDLVADKPAKDQCLGLLERRDQQLEETLEYVVDPPRARVYETTGPAQNIPNAVNTAITFTSVAYNTGLWVSTANTRLTVPRGAAGVYHINGGAAFVLNASIGQLRILSLRRNGTEIIKSVNARGDGNYDTRLEVSCDYYLNDLDYVELVAYQNTGGNLALVLGAAPNPQSFPQLSCRRVA